MRYKIRSLFLKCRFYFNGGNPLLRIVNLYINPCDLCFGLSLEEWNHVSPEIGSFHSAHFVGREWSPDIQRSHSCIFLGQLVKSFLIHEQGCLEGFSL